MKNFGKKLLTIYAAAFTAFVMLFGSLSIAANDDKKKSNKNIVEVAIEAGQFKTLAAALEAADLVDALKADGSFTVFAPTDEAFAKLPAGTVETLLKPENKEKLRAILLYHVVKGKIPAKKVVEFNGKSVGTLQGGTLMIDTSNGVMINKSKVIKADVMASNGIIHVIDTVLIPGN